MRKIGKRIILGLVGVAGVGAVGLAAFTYGEQYGRSSAKPGVQYVEIAREENARTISHPDGARSFYLLNEGAGGNVLRRYDFSRNGELFLMTLYRMDGNGKAMGAKIFDSRKEELFKVSYGYRKSDGVLAEERVFDSRIKRISPEDGKELPVQRFIHTWDEDGKPLDRVKVASIAGSEAAHREITPFLNPFVN